MRNCDFERYILPAVTAVLETMFFSEPLGPSERDTGAANLEAHVSFSGEISGILGVRISQPSARSLAASFLGEFEETLTETQIAEVVCEFTNMLCGWIVSKPESRACFDLGSPELLSACCEQTLALPAAQESFAIENGTLTVSLYPGVTA